ncbi:hypothetical protein SXCC_01881 [Gluconacetobacter sp. SXCC-1]|nr:hypothetical protein SXCC_01881 [Gluconacetobacter sp. SXCC-1]
MLYSAINQELWYIKIKQQKATIEVDIVYIIIYYMIISFYDNIVRYIFFVYVFVLYVF